VFGVIFCSLYDYYAFLYMYLCSSTDFYRVISVCDFFSKSYLDYRISTILCNPLHCAVMDYYAHTVMYCNHVRYFFKNIVQCTMFTMMVFFPWITVHCTVTIYMTIFYGFFFLINFLFYFIFKWVVHCNNL
jgi:hypothetical protein